jgi:uncharacterized metal-binding protein
MSNSTGNISVDVEAVKGVCPTGENWAKQNILDKKTPVLSCEGLCIRGDIARPAANMVAKEHPYARCRYAEVALVPNSSMAQWVKESEKIIMIDGCFLKCVGRILKNLVNEEKIVQIDARPLYKKYTDVFLMDDVPEAERKEVARQVVYKILVMLREKKGTAMKECQRGSY